MLPFEVSSVEFSRPSMSQPVFVLDYQGAEGEYLSLQVADADLSMMNDDVEETADQQAQHQDEADPRGRGGGQHQLQCVQHVRHGRIKKTPR